MSVRFESMAPWQGAERCTSGPQPGARALLAYWLEQAEPLARSLGIFNCRTVRGGSTTSLHGEGRAVDCGVPITDEGHAVMYAWLAQIAPHARRLGVQCVIFDRTIWSDRRAAQGERYGGAHPHTDHAHVELTWKSANELTLATLRAVAGDLRDEGPPEDTSTPPAPRPSERGLRSVPVPSRLTRNGDGPSASVRIDQGLLLAHGQGPARLVDRDGLPDGHFGDGTEARVRDFQQRQSIGVDGIVGPQTRTRLLATLNGRGTIVRRGETGAAAGRVQGLLMAHGFGPDGLVAHSGRPDRDFGPRTEELVRAFQRSRSFAVDGLVGPETYRGLLWL